VKVLIDIDRALAEGKITQEERDRLKALAGGQTSDLALNILIGFGVVSVTVALLAMAGSVAAVAGCGIALSAVGAGLVLRGGERWHLLGQILLVLGACLLAFGLVALDEGSARAMLYAAALLAGAAILADNGLLAALATLALLGAMGGSTEYSHARYTVIIERPAEAVAVFTALALALLAASMYLPHRFERIALVAARTSALIVNFAFLIGSLWGDRIREQALSRDLFCLVWALALLAAGVWAWRSNRRWPLVAATVFGALHFYTQWFERLGAAPGTILMAGLIAIGIGYGLKRLLGTMPAHSA
jgi:iron complex transport system permease protein